MQPSRVARRYAAALFHMARQENLLDAVDADLRLISLALRENPRILEALTVPRVPNDRKKAVLQSLFGERVQPVTRRFLDLMVNNKRVDLLPQSAEAYSLMADESRNVVAASVRTAVPMDVDQTQRLKARLDELTGRDTRLETTLDPDLLGGLVVRIGDTIMDGSVRGYLEQFEEKLRSVPMNVLARKGSSSAIS